MNGSNNAPVVKTVCPGPATPGRKGPVAGGQTLSVAEVIGGTGNTGPFSQVFAWFVRTARTASGHTPTQRTFTRYGQPKTIPMSVRVPCDGHGRVEFTSCPYSAPRARRLGLCRKLIEQSDSRRRYCSADCKVENANMIKPVRSWLLAVLIDQARVPVREHKAWRALTNELERRLATHSYLFQRPNDSPPAAAANPAGQPVLWARPGFTVADCSAVWREMLDAGCHPYADHQVETRPPLKC